ncbi:MAG: type II toxin-antitoxin system HicB family antitoxin [Bacteroidales bacterium]|nr:type II toxin-antitoxin system HicB family antitoxin [Bacteroidales bacterium]
MKKLTVIIESAPNNYGAYIKEIDGIVAIGYSIPEMKEKIKESISVYKECCVEDGFEIPDILQGEYELEYHIDVKSFLEVYSGIFTKAGLERLTGVNQKQLWHYANGDVKPRKRQRERIESAIHRLGRDLMAFCL